MEFMYSEKNKKLILLEGYKFGFQKKLADDIDCWICVKRTCKSYLKINNLNIIVDKSIIHNHEKDDEKKLNIQKLSNISKREAQEALHERPAKIIHCELAKSDIETIDAQDLYRIRKNIHTSRCSTVPKLPKKLNHGIRKPRSGRGGNKASSVVIERNPHSSFRIGTWNIRTALKAGKIEEIKEQIKNNYIGILGICETRWSGKGDYITEDFRVIHSGNDKSGKNGIAIIVQGKWKSNIMNTYHLNDRLLIVKIHAQPTDIYIIQVYFPTSNCQDVEIERMYE
ncbi:Endonuclease/exonuclease/phosphatase [Cinara cedri]|uniref:Endonuclease/exonuclease/phosphatase n=1 Tax=Cinara cedri TaxID=506608 RepID=A0A5E4NFH3_9HEMI|nr:Endonuclease/exonuclease/phosphatase [Cinara cedri]